MNSLHCDRTIFRGAVFGVMTLNPARGGRGAEYPDEKRVPRRERAAPELGRHRARRPARVDGPTNVHFTSRPAKWMANDVQIGVLIIGSLYWDKSEPRAAWRNERLDFEREERVRVPIRYGRRSTTRGDTYTMVISSGLAEQDFGEACAVPCASDDLFSEAEHLWAAERDVPDGADGTMAKGWGCVGFLEHPNGRVDGEERKRWTNRVQGKPCYGSLPHGRNERSAVDNSGFLSIDWPKTLNGSLLEWDVLLATATRPTLDNGEYPSSRDIAQAWQTTKGQAEVKYFWENRNNGIKTFQDDELEAILGSLEDQREGSIRTNLRETRSR